MKNGQVVVYVSQQLKPQKENYQSHDLELAVIVFSLKMWFHYLYGFHFEMYTGHKILKQLFVQK